MLRKWSIKYLGAHMIVHISQFKTREELEKLEKFNGFDLLVKVLKVHEKDDQTVELRIKDITARLWSIDLPKNRFNGVLSVHNGEIIRIRNVMTELTNRRNILTPKNDTNVLKFLPSAKIVSHMTSQIPNITDQDKMLL